MVNWIGLSLKEKFARLLENPLEFRHVCSRDLEVSKAETGELVQEILCHWRDGTNSEELAYHILTHPTCLRRMYAASALELGRTVWDAESVGHILGQCLVSLAVKLIRLM